LRPATAGSLGLDLAAASVDVDILTTAAQRVPTATKGPLIINGTAMGALIIGRSSTSLMGLIVMPGLLGADYTGLIYVMVWTLAPPIRISKGALIALLVPLPQFTKSMTPLSSEQRKDKHFGSSGGLALLTMGLAARPKVRMTITYHDSDCILDGLLDTGADSSTVDLSHWPQNWPMLPSMVAVTGVGGLTLAKKSPTVAVEIDRKTVTTVLSIVPLPDKVQCLISRNILAQMRVIL
ncbi:POK9 protein, partial [Pteruthius melanotis]|nr:POK9 protein [Pteruthius melanotis]